MKQSLVSSVVIPDTWESMFRGRALHGRGNAALLSQPLTAFFASRICPATAIHAGLAWALEQVDAGATVIGGFQSPLERSVLNLLLEARSPAVAVLARDVASARLPAAWREPIQRRRLTVVSQTIGTQRLDTDRAVARNDLVATLAERVVVAHAQAGGKLKAQIQEWQHQGKTVELLHHEPI